MEAESANSLITEFTTAKFVWLAAIVRCTAVAVIRGIRRKGRLKRRDCGPDVDKSP